MMHETPTFLSFHPLGPDRYEAPGTSSGRQFIAYDRFGFWKIIMGAPIRAREPTVM